MPRRAFIRYEISLRGAWPAKQYDLLLELQNSLLDLLVKVMLNISRLPKPWVRAVLERTRLGDPRFIAHLSSSIQMSALALKTGVPIPALTTPVVEELYSRSARYGFEVTLKQEPDLPAHVDAEVLRSEVYMHFSVACVSLFALANRLDRVTAVVKELCGETFGVRGLDGTGLDAAEEPLLAQMRSRDSAV